MILPQNTSAADDCLGLVKNHSKFYEWTQLYFHMSKFIYMLKETSYYLKLKQVMSKKRNFITNLETLMDRLNIV